MDPGLKRAASSDRAAASGVPIWVPHDPATRRPAAVFASLSLNRFWHHRVLPDFAAWCDSTGIELGGAAGTRWDLDSQGRVTAHPAGVPRFAYDAAGARRGLRCWSPGENRLPHSDDFASGWIMRGIVVEPSPFKASDGVAAARLTISAAGAGPLIYKTGIPAAPGETLTFSFLARGETALNPRIAMYNETAGRFIFSDEVYTPGRGAFARISRTFTVPRGCTAIRPYLLRGCDEEPVSTTGSLVLACAQISAGPPSSPFVASAGAPSIAPADHLSFAALPEADNIRENGGTFAIRYMTERSARSVAPGYPFLLGAGKDAPDLLIRRSGPSGSPFAIVGDGAERRTLTPPTSIAPGSFGLAALAWHPDARHGTALSVNGSAAVSLACACVADPEQPGFIGYDLDGVVDEILIDDRRWSNAHLQGLAI
ncbi:phage head spike fiber domain-containing protein [Terrihabitans sp. B22-R8]|uniref:phage head spike fiber domain-containing protein n=1 Tax=Terrihabitans sp. B22-R8 TaxID=3425128 RepID=UPI00403C52E3